MKPDILITGATGNTGLPLVRALTDAGIPVRALVHTRDKKSMLAGDRVEVVGGDLGDARSLERALTGIRRAYLVSPASLDQAKLQSNFIDVARLTGLEHIVKLSALGTAKDSAVGLLRAHAEIEDYIMKSGITYTFLQAHFFMENLLGNAQTVKEERAVYSPLGDARISTIAVRDIAAVAAVVLREGGFRKETYILTGPEAVSYSDVARALSDVTGRVIKYIPVSFEAAEQAMLKAGVPSWYVQDLITLMRTWSDGRGGVLSTAVETITGRKPLSLRDFILQHKGLFSAAA